MRHFTVSGKSLPAMAVNADTAVGMVTLNQLEHFGVKSPWYMAKTAKGKLDKIEQPFKELREVVQRTWDKQRSKRADLYSAYIEHVEAGTVAGATPPVTVYVDHAGTEDDGTLSFPYTAAAIAIDGETQLEARFRLRDRKPETGDVPFAVTIYHDCPEIKAMQILHDFNRFAKPIPEAKLGMRNAASPVSQVIDAALAQAPDVTLNVGSSVGTKKHAAGYQQAMAFVAGYVVGKPALDKPASGWFDALSTPGNPPINGQCQSSLTEMLLMAKTNPQMRSCSIYFWQVAGVLAHEGRAPATLNWNAAFAAAKAVSPNVGPGVGKGGSKGVTKDRLAAIYNGFKS